MVVRHWTRRKSLRSRRIAYALLKNPVAVGFLDAQEEMHEIQNIVKKTVGKTIELGRIPLAEDLSEGSCGSGCGCH